MTYASRTVSERQYLPRDCGDKLLALMHYLTVRNKYPDDMKMQRVLLVDTPPDDAEDEFMKYITAAHRVSDRARLYAILQEILLVDNTIEVPIAYKLPAYTTETSSIGVEDRVVIYDIHTLLPRLAGAFFETLLAHILHRVTTITPKHTTTPLSAYAGVLQRHKLLRTGTLVCNTYTNALMFDPLSHNPHVLCVDDFRSLYYALAFKALITITRDIDSDVYGGFTKLINYIDAHETHINTYYLALQDTNIIRDMRRERNLTYEHALPATTTTTPAKISDDVRNHTDIRGIADFISDDCVTDIKVYKSTELDEWYAQVYMYRSLAPPTTTPRELRVINLYDGKIHHFNTPN